MSVRQLAWLHAVPSKAPAKEKEGSRLSELRKAGREPKLPDVSLGYLRDFLLEVGPSEAGGFGPAPLTHQELLAWQMNMQRRLQPWELQMMHRLSREWCSESHRATDPDSAPPWNGEVVTLEERLKVASNLKAVISGMAS